MFRPSTEYHAVFLTGGLVYFGKLADLGSAHPILTDVFYVQQITDPESKKVNGILVKRGKEWHGPTQMYLNPTQILFVEPVSPDSRVAQLIREAK